MANADAETGRWAGQRERRRAEFIDAALAAIEEHGPQTSTEQVAAFVGVTRTKLYRHFNGAADLQREVARRAGDMIATGLAPLWLPTGSMAGVIDAAVRAHVQFLTTHRNLYEYLRRCAVEDSGEASNAFADIAHTLSTRMTALFDVYLRAFGVDADAERPAFAIVGLVDSAAGRWLTQSERSSQEELIGDLCRWIWLIVDDVLRTAGVYVDPNEVLLLPEDIANAAEIYRDPTRLLEREPADGR